MSKILRTTTYVCALGCLAGAALFAYTFPRTNWLGIGNTSPFIELLGALAVVALVGFPVIGLVSGVTYLFRERKVMDKSWKISLVAVGINLIFSVFSVLIVLEVV